MIFILLLQIVASLILMKLVWWGHKKFKLNVTFHNLPIIIMCLLLIVGGSYLALYNGWMYFPVGALLGAFIWTLNSIVVHEQQTQSWAGKMLISLIVCLVWPQIIVFMIFYGLNSDKINLDEEV